MPKKTWAHSGGDFLTTGVSMFSTSSSLAAPAWDTATATWIATDDENGDTGLVNIAGSGGVGVNAAFAELILEWRIEDDSSIDPAETVNTVEIAFDWSVVNGPMGTGTANSNFSTGLDGIEYPCGTGTQTGSYSVTVDGATFGAPTIGDMFFYFGDPGGITQLAVTYTLVYTAGAFSAYNARVAVSNLQFIVNYGASSPAVTDVSPAHGDAAGGTVVTLTGTDLDTGTNAFFNGTAATGYVAASATSATCVSPAHAVGAVTVTVT